MIEFISSLASAGAFAVSIIYSLGFIIIVFNLSQYGIEEFQLLNFKYIYAGFTFTANHIMFLAFDVLFFTIVFQVTHNIVSPLLISLLLLPTSLLAAAIFTFYVAKNPKTKKTVSAKQEIRSRYFFFVTISIIGSLYPSSMLSLHILDFMSSILTQTVFQFPLNVASLNYLRGFTISVWLLFFFAQMLYYSRHYYGKPNPLSSIDRTGIGLPSKVQFIFEESKSNFFAQIGVQSVRPGVTKIIQLIESTNDDYIILIPPDNDPYTITGNAIKISKQVVAGVIYQQDEHFEKQQK